MQGMQVQSLVMELRSHILWINLASVPQLLKPEFSRACVPQLERPPATAGESAPSLEKTWQQGGEQAEASALCLPAALRSAALLSPGSSRLGEREAQWPLGGEETQVGPREIL